MRLPFFVYGTLLSGQSNAGVWGSAVSQVRPAHFLNGVLYDLGAFPMLIEGACGVVVGQLVDVKPEDYVAVLRRLDYLEQYDPQDAGVAPYRRESRFVLLDEGRVVAAWVYLGNILMVNHSPIISSGDWREHTRQ